MILTIPNVLRSEFKKYTQFLDSYIKDAKIKYNEIVGGRNKRK